MTSRSSSSRCTTRSPTRRWTPRPTTSSPPATTSAARRMEWFWDAYAPDHAQRAEITASPNQATVEQLRGLPPTLAVRRRGRRPARRGRGVRRQAPRRGRAGHDRPLRRHRPRLHAAQLAERHPRHPRRHRPGHRVPARRARHGLAAGRDGVFDGFAEHEVPTGRGRVFARVGGERPAAAPAARLPADPPHVAHRGAAARRARTPSSSRTCPATGPPSGRTRRPDHAAHSKRALAVDLVQAMAALGHDRFAVAGHDRGGRVAYRMALDHPDRVTAAAAVLDVVPTGEVWARADARDGARATGTGRSSPSPRRCPSGSSPPTPTRSSTSTSARSASAVHRTAIRPT